MSTKIYVAYRLKKNANLWDFTRDVIEKGEKLTAKNLAKAYIEAGLHAGPSQLDPALLEESEERARLKFGYEAIRSGYRAQLTDYQRNHYDFSCSIGVWEHENRIYLIPYSGMAQFRFFDFLKKDPRLEPYHYFNNVDKPKDVSTRAWNMRGKTWDAIDDNGWRKHLVIDVMSYSKHYLICPYMSMLLKLVKKEDATR